MNKASVVMERAIVIAAVILCFGVLAQQNDPWHDEHWHEYDEFSHGDNIADSGSGVETPGIVQRTGDQIIGTVIAPSVLPPGMTRREAPLFERLNSLLRYEHRSFKNSDVYYNRYGLSLHGTWNLAADMPLDISIPIDRFEFNREDLGFATADIYNNTTIGIVLVPRYYIANQVETGVDVAIGLAGFYQHVFYDKGTMDDRDVIGVGPLVSIRRDFEKLSVGGGAMMQRGWNMNGDREVTGHRYVDIYRAAINIGVPISFNFVVNGLLTYTYIDDMPSTLDDSYFSAGLGATWLIKGNWAMDAAVMTDLDNSGSDNLLAKLGLIWSY